MRTDREKHGLIGPVKSVETAQFEWQGGQLVEQPSFSSTVTFNQHGWLIEQVHRNSDGSKWRSTNEYSDSGKLLAMRSFDPSGTLNGEMRYIYDDEGRLVAEQHITRDGKVTTPTTYAYDRAGGKVKIQELDFTGEASVMIDGTSTSISASVMMIEGTSTAVSMGEAKRVESRCDDQGEPVEVKVFNAGGALVSRVEITRDARGNPLEETEYVGDVVPFDPCASGSCATQGIALTQEQQAEFAALTEEQQAEVVAEIGRLFSPGTAMSKHTHRYDEEGRLIESRLTMMGMEAIRQTFAYDETGNKSEEMSYHEDRALRSKAFYAREYDGHGNWTKELVSTTSSWDAELGPAAPAHETRRVITYW